MYINTDKLQTLLEQLKTNTTEVHETQKINAGGILYEPTQMNSQLIILVKGDARIIDKERVFKNLTVDRVRSPYVFGISQLLNKPYPEYGRAATNSEIIAIKFADLDENAKYLLQEELRSKLDESEWPYLYDLIGQKFQNCISQIDEGRTFRERCKLVSSQSAYNNFFKGKDPGLYPIVYIDIQNSGFNYGQFITPEICEISFQEDCWPRLLIYTEPLAPASNAFKSDSITEEAENDIKQKKTIKPNNEFQDSTIEENKTNFAEQQDRTDSSDGFTIIRSTDKRGSY